MIRKINKKILALVGAAPFLLPHTVSAHSFGIVYKMPVPLWMYLYGGAAAIILTFLIVGYLYNKKNLNLSYPTINLSNSSLLVSFTNPWFLATLKVASVFIFLLVILTGLLGENNPYSNFNMTFFWIIFALGLTYTTALTGDIYSFINPWMILTDWLKGTKVEGLIKYPKGLGYYPALLFYFLFIWLELVGETTPVKLSLILATYTLLNGLGVVAFGKESWFRHCEFFSVFFRLIGKMAPIEYRSGKLYLRPPFIGLLREKADHFSLLLFVLFMLSSTAFDGFKETITWVRFYWEHLHEAISPVFGGYYNAYVVFETVGLLLSPLLFLCIYLLLIALSKVVAKSTLSIKDLTLQFAFSLLPIALVYNVAHYYTLMFTVGPNIIPLISDPFGFGWNLFNTANYNYRFLLVVSSIWHSQVALILLGHSVSVYLAHLVALNIFATTKKAFLSQFPMLILMIAYTVIGLWILSQPITGGTNILGG